MSTNTTQQLKQGYVSKLINSDPQLLDVTRPTPPRRGVSVWQLALLLGALGLVYTQSTVGLSNRFGELLRQVPPVPGCGLSVERDHEFVWGEIQPSKELTWVSCYKDKQCARFEVPLDYGDPSGPQAAIALLKVPSKVSVTSDGYRGPIFFNPGGPGNSGVSFILREAERFQKILGGEYDLIGFDPRGIGRTTPQVVTFDDAAEGTTWSLKEQADPLPNATHDAFARAYARSKVFGALAAQRTSNASAYVSTAFVARDLLRMNGAHGRDKLQYWGFSYGTVLGITFASMFPDNVGRLIVDGVEDTYDYYSTLWSNNLLDTDASLKDFADACVDAGKDDCALYQSDSKNVMERLNRLFESLKLRPIAVEDHAVGSTALDYGLVDYSLVRRLVFAFLYRPYSPGPLSATALAHAIAAADAGDGRPFWELQKTREERFLCECAGTAKPTRVASGAEMGLAVACSDGDAVEDSLDELRMHFEKLAQTSSFADMWTHRVRCAGWKVRPKERFTGPFVANTSTPILFIGNTLDPVTPLVNARKIARGFPGSEVLTQESGGHCSIAATSACTAEVVRAYFQDGVLPAQDTVCKIEDKMFGDGDALLEVDDGKIHQRMQQRSKEAPRSFLG